MDSKFIFFVCLYMCIQLLSGNNVLPYCCEKEPTGGAPYIGPRLGGGPIFKVSVSQLDAKERPGKLPTGSSNSNSSRGYY